MTPKGAIRAAREITLWVLGQTDPIPLAISKRQARALLDASTCQFTLKLEGDELNIWTRFADEPEVIA